MQIGSTGINTFLQGWFSIQGHLLLFIRILFKGFPYCRNPAKQVNDANEKYSIQLPVSDYLL